MYALAMDTPGYHDHKADYLKRLRRIEGQVRGLQRMVDEDVYCIDILTQVSAVKSALQSVSVGLVEDHLGHCVQDAVAGAAAGDSQGQARAEEKVAEASAAITRLLKS
jgi:CsoR family transcriptional regulator, copper-sensing transcriptional repressor